MHTHVNMEPFKNLINAEVVRQTGHHLKRADASFKRQRFEQLALDGLEGLAFKDRARHLARALHATLPADFNQAADQLEACLKQVPKPHINHDPDKELGAPSRLTTRAWPAGRCGRLASTSPAPGSPTPNAP